MGLRKAYQAMYRAFSGESDAMTAAQAGASASLQSRVYDTKGQVVLTEMVLAMQALSGTTHFAAAIARRSGGEFASLPALDDERDNDELLTKFAQIVDQLGMLVRMHAQEIADGKTDACEKAELEQFAPENYRLVQALLTDIHAHLPSAGRS